MPTAFDRAIPPDDKNPLTGLLNFTEIDPDLYSFGTKLLQAIADLIIKTIEEIPIIGPVVKSLLDTLVYFLSAGTITDGNLEALAELLTNIPLIADLIGIFTGAPGLSGLAGLTAIISDLLALLGSPLGLGTGSVVLAALENIPILGPVVAFIEQIINVLTGGLGSTIEDLVSWVQTIPIIGDIVQAITGIVGGLTDLTGWFTDLLALLGNPSGLGSGNLQDILASLENVPILGSVLSLIEQILSILTGGGSINDLLGWVEGIPIIGDVVSFIVGLFGGGQTSVGSITDQPVNALWNPGFKGAASLAGSGIWSWDHTVFRSDPSGDPDAGSATVVADGTYKALRSNPLKVTPGKQVALSAHACWLGLVGTGEPIILGVLAFDTTGTVIDFGIIDSAAAPGVNPTWFAAPGGSKAADLSGSYTAPAGADTVRMRLVVDSTATAGQVWFDDANMALTGLLASDLVGGITGGATLGGDLQSVVDQIYQAATGQAIPHTPVDSVLGNLTNIPAPNVLGVGGPANIFDTFRNTWDQLWSGLNLVTGSGMTINDVATSTGILTGNVATATQTLAIRNNKPAYHGIDPTQESVFPLGQLTGASASTLAVNNSTARIGFIRIGQETNKTRIQWIGSGTTNITGMYFTAYTMDTDGDLTRAYHSDNVISSVSDTLSWNSHDIPAGSEIFVEPGDVVAVELAVTGNGTYNLVGQSMTWMPAHPVALPSMLGATRNNANASSAPATIDSANVAYSNSVPWLGLGLAVESDWHIPELTQYGVGNHTYTIPLWAKILDVILLGGGAGGQGGGAAFMYGTGGRAGSWATATLIRGDDIPDTTTTLSITVGSGGAGTAGGLVPNVGGYAGGSSSASGTGWAGLTASGGTGRDNPAGDPGLSPGNQSYQGNTYYGGQPQYSYGSPGGAPGGGGSGGGSMWFFGLDGGPGASGAAFIVARTA